MFSSCLNTSHMPYTCCQGAKAVIHWHILGTGQDEHVGRCLSTAENTW